MVVRRALAALGGVSAVALLGGASLEEPVLHEFFDIDEVRGGAAGAAPQGPFSGFPARVDTPSGTISSPPKHRELPDARYAQGHSAQDQYRLDGDTSRPDLVGYSDPFTPSVLPFKRSFAYDTVTDTFELGIADAELTPFKVGGALQRGDDQFFADISLSVRTGQVVRVPSVGPQARVLAAKLQPAAAFELLHDSADNWYIRTLPGDYRLVMHLAVQRLVFGSPFAAANWQALSKHLPPLPSQLDHQTAGVLAKLGLSQSTPPAEALARLVAHFRGFTPSDSRQTSTGVELYQSIALSQSGVCRHRSFAFAVTALGLGIPSRFVRNEAHAWVEVFDGTVWHRIDLGGAAGRMEMVASVDVPHSPPADPFSWPGGSESGAAMASQALRSASQSEQAATNEEESVSPATAATASGSPVQTAAPAATQVLPPSQSLSTDAPPLESTQEPTAVSLATDEARATRGMPIRVAGQVKGHGGRCDLTRVDIKLQSAAGQWFSLGTLVTDKQGRYGGQVVVPTTVPVGDYELFALTPGSQHCAAGNSLDIITR